MWGVSPVFTSRPSGNQPPVGQENAKPRAEPTTTAVKRSGSATVRQRLRNVSSMMMILEESADWKRWRHALRVERGAHPDGAQRNSCNAARDRPQRDNRAKARLSPGDLDGLQIQRARLALVVRADVIAKTLADGGSNVLVPLDRALFEAKVVAASFLLDFAVTLGGVKRLDRSEIFHGEFLSWHPPEVARCR